MNCSNGQSELLAVGTEAYFSPEIFDVTFARSNLERLLFRSVEVLFLTHVGHERDHFIVLVKQILEDTAGVQAA